MEKFIYEILTGISGIFLGVSLSMFVFKKNKFIDFDKKQKEANVFIENGKKETEEIKKAIKKTEQDVRRRTEEELLRRTEMTKKTEAQLKNKEDNIKKKEEKLRETKLRIASYKEEIQSRQNEASRSENTIIEKLSLKTGRNKSEIKAYIINFYLKNFEQIGEKRLSEAEEDLKENVIKKAKNILIGTIQRISSPTSVESRVVLIKALKDDIKGKIVGMNGRNIFELERLLGVAIVFNDLPNTISLSSYNLVQRRIAEKTLEKLVRTRREIDPHFVNDAVKEATRETDEELYEIGKDALEKMDLKNRNKDFARVVGRLKYRTSYGQNIMKHSMEVAWIATMLGSELNLDVSVCKVAGFLHDLGKAIDQDPEIKDAHDRLTKELMEKFGFLEEEIHAAWAHHDAEKQKTAEALIVKAADAVSGGRPGARQDSIERYVERMQAIDDTVRSFSGVKKVFAMSAGREVRVFVDPEKISDTETGPTAKNIAKKIEENVVYPGRIKIKVIRRTKVMDIAK